MRNDNSYKIPLKQKSDIIASNINFIHKAQDTENKFYKNSQNLNNDETQNNENIFKSQTKNSIDNFNKSYSFNSSSYKKMVYTSNFDEIHSLEKYFEGESKKNLNEELINTSSKKNPSISYIQNMEAKPTKFNQTIPKKIDYSNPTIIKNVNYEQNQENLLYYNSKNKEEFKKGIDYQNAKSEIYKYDNFQKTNIEKNKSIKDFVFKRSESFRNKRSNNNIIKNSGLHDKQLYNNQNKCMINKINFESFNNNYDLGFPNNNQYNLYSDRFSLKQSNIKVNKFINLRDSLEIPSLTTDRYALPNKIMQNKANSNSQYFNNNNIVKNNIFNKSIIYDSINNPFSNQNPKNNQNIYELDNLINTKNALISNNKISYEIRENNVTNLNNKINDTSSKNGVTFNDSLKYVNEDKKFNLKIKENSIIPIIDDFNDKIYKSFNKKDSNVILSKKNSSNTNEKLSNNSLNSFTHKATLAKIYSKEIEKLNDFIDEQEQECDLETLIFKNLQGSLILKNNNNYNSNNFEIAEAQNNYYRENENDKTISENSEKFASPNLSNKNINDFFDINSSKSDNFSYIDKVIENNQTKKEFEKNKKISFSELDEIDKINVSGFNFLKENVLNNNSKQNLSKNNNSTILDFNNLTNSKSIIVNKSNSLKKIDYKEKNVFNKTLDNRIFLSGNNVLNFKDEPQNISKHNGNNSIVKIINNIDEKNKNNFIDNKILENIRNSNKLENENFQIKIDHLNNFENKDLNNEENINSNSYINSKNESFDNFENSKKIKEMSDKLQTKKIFNICFSNLILTKDKTPSTNHSKDIENVSESNNKLTISSSINLKNSNRKSGDTSDCHKMHSIKNSNGNDNNLILYNNLQFKENIKNFDENQESKKELAFLHSHNPNKSNNQDIFPQNSFNVSCDFNSKKHSNLKSLSKKISNTKYVNKKLENLSFSRNSNNSRLSVSHKGNFERFSLSSNIYNTVNKSNFISMKQ